MNELVIQGCEQVLRFTSVSNWHDLSEERKVQLGFNMGVVALGLNLTKVDGYDMLASTRSGGITINELHMHMRKLVAVHDIKITEVNVARSV